MTTWEIYGEISEITLTVQGDAITARRQNGAEAHGKVAEVGALETSTIQVLADLLRRGKLTRFAEVQLLGKYLYKAIFNDGTISSFVSTALREAKQANNTRLCIILDLKGAPPDFANLPWEFLFNSDSALGRGGWLCTETDLILTRSGKPSLPSLAVPPLDEGPLKVLFVLPFEEKARKSASDMVEVLRTAPNLDNLNIHTLDKPTPGGLVDECNRVKPHVLHFIAGGRFIRGREVEAAIALLGDDEQAVIWRPSYQFAQDLARMKNQPRLIFLQLPDLDLSTPDNQSEHSYASDFESNFAALAPNLVQEPVQAIVAMQYPMSRAESQAFSKTFYQHLVQGVRIDAAVQAGRYRLTAMSSTDSRIFAFGTPVMFLYKGNGIIKPPSEQTRSDGSMPTSTSITPANPLITPTITATPTNTATPTSTPIPPIIATPTNPLITVTNTPVMTTTTSVPTTQPASPVLGVATVPARDEFE